MGGTPCFQQRSVGAARVVVPVAGSGFFGQTQPGAKAKSASTTASGLKQGDKEQKISPGVLAGLDIQRQATRTAGDIKTKFNHQSASMKSSGMVFTVGLFSAWGTIPPRQNPDCKPENQRTCCQMRPWGFQCILNQLRTHYNETTHPN